MTPQQLNELKTSRSGQLLRRAMFYMNNAYVLADVVNSFMIEANSTIAKMGQELTQDNKRRFNRLKKMMHDANCASRAIAKEIYGIPSEDDACEDSDYYYEAIKLLAVKTGNTREDQEHILSLLRSLPDVNAEIVEPE